MTRPHARLVVSVYRSCAANHSHWALEVRFNDPGTDDIYVWEVLGERGTLHRHELREDPEDTRTLMRLIDLGSISEHDVLKARSLFQKQHVDNDTPQWNCQDFVLELLETLEEAEILDSWDDRYVTAKRRVREKLCVTP